jgi:hypothetical protein
MGFDPELEGGFGEMDDANRRIVQFWGPGSSLDGKPYFEGITEMVRRLISYLGVGDCVGRLLQEGY